MSEDDNKSVMYSSEEVERTLNDTFLTDALRVARKKELELLQEELGTLYDFFKTPLKIFDIGVGDGYVPINLQRKLLNNIEGYIGIDNSLRELKQFEKNVHEAKLENKIRAFEFDANNLADVSFHQKLPLPFHAVICTYFTPGNFRPDEIKLEEDEAGHIKSYPIEILNPNKKFQKVFSEAYKLLCDGGKLILGSIYIDSPTTRLKQEEFYKNCGMHVISTKKDSFTATREGFWSQRFTNEKIYSYFNWIDRNKIKFLPLDSENFAQMIIVTK